MSRLLTISEAATLLNKSQRTVYRYINKGKLSSIEVSDNGKTVVKIPLEEIERLLNLGFRYSWEKIDGQPDKGLSGAAVKLGQVIDRETLQEFIDKSIEKSVDRIVENTRSQLMKPLQEQATFVAGKLSAENQHLKEKLETVLEENRVMREHLKLLPAPAEEMVEEMNKKQEELKRLQEEYNNLQSEKDRLATRLSNETSRHQKEYEMLSKRAEAMEKKQNRYQKMIRSSEEEIENLRKEKKALETRIRNMLDSIKEIGRAKEEVEAKLKAEKQKPWWKKIFVSE